MPASGDLLSYSRHFDKAGGWFIILNFGTEAAIFSTSAAPTQGVIALSTHLDREGEDVNGRIALRPDEGLIIKLAER